MLEVFIKDLFEPVRERTVVDCKPTSKHRITAPGRSLVGQTPVKETRNTYRGVRERNQGAHQLSFCVLHSR